MQILIEVDYFLSETLKFRAGNGFMGRSFRHELVVPNAPLNRVLIRFLLNVMQTGNPAKILERFYMAYMWQHFG